MSSENIECFWFGKANTFYLHEVVTKYIGFRFVAFRENIQNQVNAYRKKAKNPASVNLYVNIT